MKKIVEYKDLVPYQISRIGKAIEFLLSCGNEEISEEITNAVEIGHKNLSFYEDGCELDGVNIEKVIINTGDCKYWADINFNRIKDEPFIRTLEKYTGTNEDFLTKVCTVFFDKSGVERIVGSLN